MECADVRTLADRFLDGELPPETQAAVRQHAEACPACWLDLESRRELRLALRRAFERSPALVPPSGLEESVRAHVRAHHEERHVAEGRWSYRRWAIAAAVLIAVSAGLLAGRLRVPTVADAIAAAAAGDHRNCAVRFRLAEQPITLDDAAVRFDPALAVLATWPANSTAGAAAPLDVVARHSCVYAGHRYGHVVLRYGDTLVSLLVTARDGGPTGDDAGAIAGGGAARAGDLNTVQFHTSRHSIIVVADLSSAELEAIAALLAGPVVARIDRL